MRIYVGNLPYNVTEDEIRSEFGIYGNVESTTIPTDRMSGRPKGFAFVEIASKSEAEAAIAGLNGKMLNERTLVVSEARPREDRKTSGFYGGMGGGRGRSSGGNKRRY